MVRQSQKKDDREDIADKPLLSKKQKSRKKSPKKTGLAAIEQRRENGTEVLERETLMPKNVVWSWGNAGSLLLLYLIMDILLLMGVARFKFLFVVILVLGAYFLQKKRQTMLLSAWLTALSGLFVAGVMVFFWQYQGGLSAQELALITQNQMREIFSVASLLWTVGGFSIVFGGYIYYAKKNGRGLPSVEWYVALFNMVLFWGFMYFIFQNTL